MKLRPFFLSLHMFLLCFATQSGFGETDSGQAEKSFKEGASLLKQGKFEKALQSYARAAKLNGEKAEYRQEYMLLRQVVRTRHSIAKEKVSRKWDRMAWSLVNYYYFNNLYKELVHIATQIHEKENTIHSATLLSEAHMELGDARRAVTILRGFKKSEMNPRSRVILGIGLARDKKTAKASKILQGIKIPERAGPRFLFEVSRLKLLCGDKEGSMATLRQAFEATLPEHLKQFKDFAGKNRDFASIKKSKLFKKVLETASKVRVSPCSGCSSCSSCPSRAKCPSTKKQE